MSLEGQRVVIVGGAYGIGAAIARVSATKGAQVLIVDIDEEAAQELAGSLHMEWVLCDASDAKSVSRTAATTTSRLGGVY